MENDGENVPPTDPRSVDLTFYLRPSHLNTTTSMQKDEELDRVDVALQTPARARGIPRKFYFDTFYYY